jgi:hypothetical protein
MTNFAQDMAVKAAWGPQRFHGSGLFPPRHCPVRTGGVRVTAPAMTRRRDKWSDRQYARSMRSHHRRMTSNRQYGVTYGFPQLLHKGRKP